MIPFLIANAIGICPIGAIAVYDTPTIRNAIAQRQEIVECRLRNSGEVVIFIEYPDSESRRSQVISNLSQLLGQSNVIDVKNSKGTRCGERGAGRVTCGGK